MKTTFRIFAPIIFLLLVTGGSVNAQRPAAANCFRLADQLATAGNKKIARVDFSKIGSDSQKAYIIRRTSSGVSNALEVNQLLAAKDRTLYTLTWNFDGKRWSHSDTRKQDSEPEQLLEYQLGDLFVLLNQLLVANKGNSKIYERQPVQVY